ncbi:MAG: LacI family DNA-binding transcriptional regulator [Rhodobacteraceae bacterium]|nr:LacI family DNA-binding transcriptional regulator [Paracoccaceae bacterium]
MSRITLQNIASETGLSKFAVSRALAGKSGVSEDTRNKVIDAAERLGYRRTGEPEGCVVAAIFDARDQFNGEQHMQVQSGLQSEALKCGCTVRMHWTHDTDDLPRVISDCHAILAVNIAAPESVALLRDSGKPLLQSGWFDVLDPVSTINGTDHASGHAVGSYLLERGHREIVYVHGDAHLRGRRKRLNGLREALYEVPEARYHDLWWDASSSFTSRMNDVLAAGGRPTAFFCATDGLAITAISDLLARGWKIPQDASVIGFGDFSAAQQVRPALTTMKVHGQHIGRSALRHLIARLRTPDWPSYPVQLLIPHTLVERASTGPAPGFAGPATPDGAQRI